ncbi:hypothetical protein GCM10007352_14680 [Mucilaginibacter phyllosphaerae]|nr:hypothetical protein GCM10007352_14680 [Mucilaginibacter phyllosphaerae]
MKADVKISLFYGSYNFGVDTETGNLILYPSLGGMRRDVNWQVRVGLAYKPLPNPPKREHLYHLPQYLLNIICRKRFDKAFFGGDKGAGNA